MVKPKEAEKVVAKPARIIPARPPADTGRPPPLLSPEMQRAIDKHREAQKEKR